MRTTALIAVFSALGVGSSGLGQEGAAPTGRPELQTSRESLSQDIYFGEGDNRQLGVRCATPAPGELELQLIDRALEPYLREASRPDRAILTIPVVFHVVTKKNGDYNVTDEQIEQQMTALNDSFEPHGFRFELSEARRYQANVFAKKCLSFRAARRFKFANAVDPAHTLNIYSCRPARGVLGYAWLPSHGPEDNPHHGVVAHYATMPGGSAAPYNEGDTVVHEVGHYLGLRHTFTGGCLGAKGDRANDTPQERGPAYGCPRGRDTCRAKPGEDPIHNFMDYSDDACMDEFTPDQATLMAAELAAFKPSIGS